MQPEATIKRIKAEPVEVLNSNQTIINIIFKVFLTPTASTSTAIVQAINAPPAITTIAAPVVAPVVAPAPAASTAAPALATNVAPSMAPAPAAITVASASAPAPSQPEQPINARDEGLLTYGFTQGLKTLAMR